MIAEANIHCIISIIACLVYLADGITRIEGKSYGSPFQYMPALEYLRLPNTLEFIGPHFLCSCTAIEKLTIPASVTYIDGACFHGCSSLAEEEQRIEAAFFESVRVLVMRLVNKGEGKKISLPGFSFYHVPNIK